ncbi:MAG: FAD binding domain-containing protein [Treponema sp.]|nr:FAD binding domain-containing protein [Treponema sp.]
MSKTILYAKNSYELIKLLSNNPGTKVVGGCTRIQTLPDKFISVFGIKDLSQIVRHERFIDVGPGATLASLLSIGQTHLPQILCEAVSSIANPQIRNIATIGGNICNMDHRLTLFAPLMALDARLEFKNQTETRNESIKNFKGIPDGFVLTNIRIPIMRPELSIFRRIGSEQKADHQYASVAFLADMEKSTILNVRLAFAGPFTFSSKDFENSLMGKRLPLTQKEVSQIEESLHREFGRAAKDQMISDVLRQQFYNIARYSFEQLT